MDARYWFMDIMIHPDIKYLVQYMDIQYLVYGCYSIFYCKIRLPKDTKQVVSNQLRLPSPSFFGVQLALEEPEINIATFNHNDTNDLSNCNNIPINHRFGAG